MRVGSYMHETQEILDHFFMLPRLKAKVNEVRLHLYPGRTLNSVPQE